MAAPTITRLDEMRSATLHEDLARFPAALFQFDPRIREGWLSDRYFPRSAEVLEEAGLNPVVTMQVFAKKEGVLAGVYEVIRLLQTQLAHGYQPDDLEIFTLCEGEKVEPWTPVLHIRGPYRAFAHLETLYLGILARRTLVATNVARAVEAAAGRTLIFMAGRHDDWRVQVADGYAARVGGAKHVSTDANGAWWGERGIGTMPHALIAAFKGDTVAATLAFARTARKRWPGVKTISLVDFHNDVIPTSIAVARAMEAEFGKGELVAVRIDTSENLVDRSLIEAPGIWGREKPTGVTPHLVRKLRAALDDAGYPEVGIVVSGGFTPDKIRRFEQEGVPVWAYGVGSSLLGHNHGEGGLVTSFDFTADIVETDGVRVAKVGRWYQENPALVRVDWHKLVETERRMGR